LGGEFLYDPKDPPAQTRMLSVPSKRISAMNILFRVFVAVWISSYVAALPDDGAAVKDSNILIHIPFHLHNANGFDHVKADFGFGSMLNSYQSISEYVYFIEETLCYPVTNHSIGYPAIPSEESWKPPFILFINGGGTCSHVTKVRHGQMIGASAVVLAQPHCFCTSANCTAMYPDDHCESDPVLVNDGSAADISIPSFYLNKITAEELKTQLRKNQPVLMQLQWGLPEPTMNDSADGKPSQKRPQVQFWSTAYDPNVRLDSYINIRSIVDAFSDRIDFIPNYSILDGQRFHCGGTEPNASGEPCDHLCTNFGRYCTNHATDLSGYSILQETLRRLCIWEHSTKYRLLSEQVTDGVATSKIDQKHSIFWDYVMYHKKECASSPHTFADEHCVDAAMKHANIDAGRVLQCMADAGKIDSDTTNAKLDDALKAQQKVGVVTLPSLVFNGKILSRASGALLFDVICSEYWMSEARTVPEICIKCASCPNTMGCVEHSGHCVEFKNEERYVDPSKNNNHSNDTKKKKHYFWSTLGWLIFFGCAAGAAYYYYETQLKGVRRMGSRPLMNDYLHLNVDG
jgi:hypothetical protein